ncbi:nitric oxide synthase oxygenase [Paenibacillus yanchengensis]|uniref:Nitric oxide synthase oxygenase n=1 Tax=Paenibacillus yanchengensis TaxID=2035833 RepID=A0ABW4YH48_9BACL
MIAAEVFNEAKKFISNCYTELGKSQSEIDQRLVHIQQQIDQHGTYEHTCLELEYGSKLAWRNSNRCIGRFFWESLQVFDHRSLTDEKSIADALLQHIEYATNNGKIRSTISIFQQSMVVNGSLKEVRIWNHQLLRYAGYVQKDGSIIGDPASISFTKQCIALGWKPLCGAYDILPLVIQIDDRTPVLFEIPATIVKEVPIEHPTSQAISDLNMRWYAVPIVSDMLLEIGGVSYTAAPFNGWYMGTEIGARNLADKDRYNKLVDIAKALHLNTSHASTLWKDQALVELNIAVLHSYKKEKVTIVDHHTAAVQFKQFERKEQDAGRSITGRWSWLVPPLSPATTDLFHVSYNDVEQSPNYHYQASPYQHHNL